MQYDVGVGHVIVDHGMMLGNRNTAHAGPSTVVTRQSVMPQR
jgi:hypothetical protein